MHENIKTIFKKHQSAIIAGIGGSLLTLVVIIIFAWIFIFAKFGSIQGFITAFLKENGVVAISSNETFKNDKAAEESQIVNVVEKANPAVVSIVITKDVPIIEQYYENFNPLGNNPFGNDFFGNGLGFQIPKQRQNGTEKKEVGGGSGFFVSSDGYIVTNKHVVTDDKAEYTVLTNDGKKFSAKILAKDSALDVAVLKVDGKDFAYLSFGNSDILKSGQTVIAIGNALAEFRNSVSVGVISGLARSIVAGDMSGNSEQLEGIIQTDAAINPGNSGGPLLNIRGEVIGVNVAVQQGAENIGFALPSNTTKSIVDSVREHGEIIRPYLGVRYTPVTKILKEKNNLAVDYGVLISRGDSPEELAVIPGSPADKAGIVENDIILEIDGTKLEQEKSLAFFVRKKQVGQTVHLKLLHKGEEKELDVKLEKAPKE